MGMVKEETEDGASYCIVFLAACIGIGGRCVYGSIFSSYIYSRMKKVKPTVFVSLSKRPIQLKNLLHGWDNISDVLCLFLYSSTVVDTVCQLMLNLCMLVRILIFYSSWFLVTVYVAVF